MAVTRLHLTAIPPSPKKNDIALSGRSLSVEDARQLVEKCRRRPWQGDSTVVHITAAHRVRSDAWSVLLKVLEEPPPFVEVHLYAPSTDSIPSTIRSRAHVTRESLPKPIPEDASRLVRLYESGDALGIVREADRHTDLEETRRAVLGLWIYAIETGKVDTAVLSEYYLGLLSQQASPRVVMKALLVTLALRHRKRLAAAA